MRQTSTRQPIPERGQLLSPLIVSPIASAASTSPYLVGTGIAVIYLLQTVLTRKKQMLPDDPE